MRWGTWGLCIEGGLIRPWGGARKVPAGKRVGSGDMRRWACTRKDQEELLVWISRVLVKHLPRTKNSPDT